MEYALAVDGLTKRYPDFTLDHVSFAVPQGAIVGLIGENGAGKSTTISAILGLLQKDAGSVKVFGIPQNEIDVKLRERIGVVFDGTNFSEELSPQKLNLVLKDIYQTWDETLYYETLQKMGLPRDQKIKTFSKGMKMKLSLVVAFSHHPQLLVLDEATSGLDPVMRDDILDMFLEFVQK